MTLNSYINHSLDRKNQGVYFKKGKWILHILMIAMVYLFTAAEYSGKMTDAKTSQSRVEYKQDGKIAKIEISTNEDEIDISSSDYACAAAMSLPFFIFFYIYCLLLIPFYFKRNRQKHFWLGLFLCIAFFLLLDIALTYALKPFFPQLVRETEAGILLACWNSAKYFVSLFFSFTTMLLFMELLEEVRTSKDIHAHEHEINATELNRIKMQMNPSFMASSLDKISCLAATQDDKAPEAIVGFADVLRYRLYRSKIDKVFLEEELQQLSNLFKFQNNINSRPCCTLEVEGDTKNKGIPPLALINIAEPLINAASNDTWHLMMYLLCEDDEMQIAIEYTDAGEVAAEVLTAMKNTLDLMFGIDVIFATEKETDNYSLRICLPLYRSSIALS